VQKREGGQGTRLWVEDLPGLLGLVEIGAIELHPWNARAPVTWKQVENGICPDAFSISRPPWPRARSALEEQPTSA